MQLDRIEVGGLKELDDQLTQLGAKMGLTALRRAARAAMKPVKQTMQQNAGYDASAEGDHMRDSIGMSSKKLDRKGGRNNAVAVRVGPARKHSQKAIAQEYGTARQTAAPFMRPALFDHRHQVVNTMKTQLAQEIARALQQVRR